MINNSNTSTEDWKENFEVPYRIGTFIESKDNPDVHARIIQYRITVKNYKLVIYIGLNTDIYVNKETPDIEISMEELQKNWKILNKTSIGTLDPSAFLRIPEEDKPFEYDEESVLAHQKEKEEIERLKKELNVSCSDLELLRMMKRMSDTYDQTERILQDADKGEKKVFQLSGFKRR